jgi:hypothetical protein
MFAVKESEALSPRSGSQRRVWARVEFLKIENIPVQF